MATEKLYGLDDIPEGWRLDFLIESAEDQHDKRWSACRIERLDVYEVVDLKAYGPPQLALHKAIQKARGEV